MNHPKKPYAPRGSTPKERLRLRTNKPDDHPDTCWEWTGTTIRKGYGRLSIEGGKMLAHRLAYREFVGPIPEGMKVCHTCDNPPCCRPSHLFLGTDEDNTQDAISKGRFVRSSGEDHASHKLTSMDALFIKHAPEIRGIRKVLADMFGMSITGIQHVRKGTSWSHLN